MSNPSLKTIQKYELMAHNSRHIWAKSEIHALAKLLNHIEYIQDKDIKRRVVELGRYVQEDMKPARITDKQSNFGIQWLKTNLYNSKGNLRNSKLSNILEPIEPLLKRFKDFRFAGFHTDTNSYGARLFFVAPIYEVRSKNGKVIPYAHQHWGATLVGDYALSVVSPYMTEDLDALQIDNLNRSARGELIGKKIGKQHYKESL